MRLRSLALAALLVLALVTPALAAPPDGTMVIGLHVTLVSRWLDPGDTEGSSRRSWSSTRSTTPWSSRCRPGS